MKPKRQVAQKGYYFNPSGFAMAIRRVETDAEHRPSHPHDLTGQKHRHDFCELVIVTRGRALHWVEGIDVPVTAGDVFLLQGSQGHYFHERDHLVLINVMYDPGQIGLPENELRRMPGYCALFLLEPAYRRARRFKSRLRLGRIALARAEQMVDEMEHELSGARPGHEAALRAKLVELMVFLSRAYTETDSTGSHALLRVGSVIGALENDLSREWTLEDLQHIAHMSRSHLIRVFRKATGQSPIDYLIRLRIQKAMELLRTTDLSITEISAETGFNDSNYFSRQFKRMTSTTPTAFRKSV